MTASPTSPSFSLVSVVMCTYNGEKFLREQLDSIVQQSYPIHELLIQDDQSTDRTTEIIKEYQARYPFIRLHINEKNLGFNANFHTALCSATGDFISISDQDDVWHPDKLKEMMACIGDKAMCFSFSATPQDHSIDDIERRLNNNESLERLLFSNCVPGHSMLLRRSMIEQIPFWDDNVLYDWWLAINAQLYGGVARCNKILTNHRVHQESAMSLFYQKNYKKAKPYLPYLKGYQSYRALRKKESWQKFYRHIYRESNGQKELNTAHRIVDAMLGKSFFPVNLSFPDYKGQNNHVKIFASEFEKKILSQLNASSKILSIKPDTLDYIYSTGKSKLVPVHFQGKVTAGLQYYVSDTICSPDSVLVYAPAGILDTITTAYTQEVNLENISDTIRQRVALDNKKGVKFVPASVELTFPVDIYTEKTVEVPLRGINFPADKVLRAFPSKVQITFQVGLKRFRSIKASDFVINVSYEELLKLGSDKYTVKLKSAPRGINQIRIVPEQVDFLIEQVSSDGY